MVPPNQPTLKPLVWHVIVRKPLMELAWWVEYVKDNSKSYLINQHYGDDEDKTTHCHTMLVDCNVTIEAIRKCFKKNGIAGSAEYAIMTKTEKSRLEYDEDKLAIYILKGVQDNTSYIASYGCVDIHNWIQQWVEPVKGSPKNDGDKKEKFDNYNALLKEFNSSYNFQNRPNLDRIRTWVMKWHWQKFRRMPNPSAYKRDASSLYMVHTESFGGACVETAYEEIKNWCY